MTLELGEAYPADYSRVWRATLDGSPCVLKQPYDEDARAREVEALRLLGPPSVRLLDVRPEGLVLERVEPGAGIADLPDDEATRTLARVMRAMWRPVPSGCRLPTVDQECAALRRDVGLPAALVEPARAALADLLATAPEPVVLHGDLHHGNLLRGRDGFVAIDPHGVVGDPAYDVGPLLINPHTQEVAHLAGRRLDVLAEELAQDRGRLRQWALVRAVLSAAWTAEDDGTVDARTLRVAAALL